MVGGYRFDDPDGEVGVEAMLIGRGGAVFHVPVTYRSAPLEDAAEHLIGTTEHSVLGQRWVYDAAGDPVALACYGRALQGQQEQAVLEIYEGDTLVAVRDQTAQLRVEPTTAREAAPDVRLSRVVGDVEGRHRLVVTWPGGEGAVAATVS